MRSDTSVAIVTGASRGLGRAIAIRLAMDGYDVGLIYHDDGAAASEVTRAIMDLGRQARAIALDVADPEAVNDAVAEVVRDWGRVDALVCNAGIFSRSTIAETSDEEFDRTFAVNVRGTFNCLRAVLPIMMHQHSGRIVTISSHNAKRGTGISSKATYAATKSAVESYTKGAAVEAAPYEITVNCVSPGWIEKTTPPAIRSDFENRILAGIPLNRPGRPDDVAAAVAFLISDGAGYITGEILDVNGGTWMD